VSHVYAGDPYHRDVFAARLALAEGFNALRRSVDGMIANAIPDGPKRTSNRRHVNESPGVRVQPTGNAKQLPGRGGQVAVPGRPPMPAQPTAGQRSQLPEAALPGEQTVVVPSQSTSGPPTESEQTKTEPPKYPARPDPSDAAAEVWALVERAQAGEAEAFGLIYDRYVDTVFRFVYFRVGNRQLAEDLTSDTFLRALKRIGSFTWQGRDLGAWLVTIARNLVADHFKSGRYRLEVTTGDVLDADREDRGPEGSPESAVVDHITNVALLTAVKQLNPEQQECIVLRFLQGFSVAETAQTMGKNEGAIKALQYRAVRALARLLPEGFQW
jgi:RNA polymerase sigma-70 factor (ECF subfamily)